MEFREEKPYRKPVFIFEMIGTAILLMTFNMSRKNLGFDKGVTGHDPLVVALVYFVNIIFLGDICGGHFNPAVTLAVFIKEGRGLFKKNYSYAIFIVLS